MARRDDALGIAGADTVIGTGVTVKGNLVSEGDIVIDGHLDGKIEATGTVTIGVNAEVKAPIKSTSCSVSGHIEGNITASNDVAILATGHVEGDITATSLSIEPGGVFSGHSIVRSLKRPALEPKEEA